MAQREWVEKDFYKELGVSSEASADEIKRAYRKLARDLHPDTNADPSAAERFKAVSEAHSVLSDPAKRKEYDETRRLFAGGGFGRGRFSGGDFGGFGGDGAEFNLNDLFDAAGQTGGANIGDLFGGLFGRGAATISRPRPSCRSWRPPRAWRCRCGSPARRPARIAMAAGHARAPARGCARTATALVSSAVIRARSGSPNPAPNAGAAVRSSSTRALSAKAPA